MPGATVKDIARRARVSIGTVDRVLHQRGRAAKSTIAKVMKAAKEMDYQPNIFARSLSLAKKLRLGVVMPRSAQNGGYWKLADRGLAEAGKELASFSVSAEAYRYDRYSHASFEKAMRTAAKECPDGLLAAVVDTAGTPLLSEIMTKTPVVLFDSFIPEIEPVAFIGQDSYQSGVLSGKLMAMAADAGDIIAVQPVSGDHHISDRIRGFSDHMRTVSSRVIIEPLDGDAEDDAAVRSLLQRHSDAKGFFVASADVHRFAACAESTGGKGCIFIGYDLTEVNRTYVETGMIDFIIDQKPDVQVREGLLMLYRSVAQRTPPASARVYMPLDIITKENVRYYRA